MNAASWLDALPASDRWRARLLRDGPRIATWILVIALAVQAALILTDLAAASRGGAAAGVRHAPVHSRGVDLATITNAHLFGAPPALKQDDANAPQDGKTTSSVASDSKATTQPKEPMSVAGPDYLIGADDALHISVWKEPDLTNTLPVRPDGKISMPLLNDVQAAGLTPMQLADSLTEKLKKYLADPRVTVVVTQMNSQRIYILGEVLHSGAIPLLPNMTVLQALATAGFTQFANTKNIYVLRTQNGKQQKMPFNYRQAMKGDTVAQNINLKPGDTIVVP